MQIPNFSLDKKVVFITGGASGVGQALSVGLARVGAIVVIADLPQQQEAAEQTALAIREAGGEAMVAQLDVTRVESISLAVEAAAAKFDRIDILINNAGIIVRKKAFDVTEEEWDRVMDVNLKGVFFTSQAVAKKMAEHGGGSIVNIASINGVIGSPERAAYTASKSGVINLTRTLAAEWAEHGIRVNAIGPTYLLTPLTQTIFEQEEFREHYFRRQPIQRVGKPEDLIGAVMYLASSASELVTGHTLMVDGGWTAV